MTSPPPTDDGRDSTDAPDPDDDAILAVLDDAATVEQRRRVARDPALRARLAEQQAATEALAAPVEALDDATAARLRVRALDALDEPVPAPDDPSADPAAADGDEEAARPAVPLAPRRSARRRLPAWPAVAAVVILLVGLGLALILNDRTDETTATRQVGGAAELSPSEEAAEDAARDLGANSAGGAESFEGPAPDDEERASPENQVATSAGPPRYADEEALRQELQTIDPTTLQRLTADLSDQDTGRADEAAALCDQGLQSVEAALEPVQAARIVLMGDREVLVMSNPVAATAAGPASTRLTVFDPTSCTPLFAVQR